MGENPRSTPNFHPHTYAQQAFPKVQAFQRPYFSCLPLTYQKRILTVISSKSYNTLMASSFTRPPNRFPSAKLVWIPSWTSFNPLKVWSNCVWGQHEDCAKNKEENCRPIPQNPWHAHFQREQSHLPKGHHEPPSLSSFPALAEPS